VLSTLIQANTAFNQGSGSNRAINTNIGERTRGAKAVENRLENGYGALPKDLIDLVNNVGNDCFGICFDAGHAHVNRLNLESTLESIKEFLIATHIHDNNGFEDQHLPPMMGSISWSSLIKSFSKINYRKPLILEVHEYGRLELDDNVLKASSIIMDKLVREH